MKGGVASITQEQNNLIVSGQLAFDTVAGLHNKSLPLLAKNKTLDFDFSGVSSVDSSALALLLEWLKYAKREHKQITFQNIPAQLMSIAAVADVSHLIKSLK